MVCGKKAEEKPNCFPALSEVLTEGNKIKTMEEIRVGDFILTMKDERLVSTEILGFFKKYSNKDKDEYLNITLENGKNL